MSVYNEIILDDTNSMSYDICTNTNYLMKDKLFFIKNNDELIILNIKICNNCIYIYNLKSKKILKTFDITFEIDTDIDKLYSLIKISSDWKVISIPIEKYILLLDVNTMNVKKIIFNFYILKNKYIFYLYSEHFIITYEKENKTYIYVSNLKSELIFDYCKLDKIYISENGNYICYLINNTIKIISLYTKNNNEIKLEKFLPFIVNEKSKWLISNDGKLLLSRNGNNINIVSNIGYIDITNKIDNSKSSLITLKSVKLYNDSQTYAIISWNYELSRYTIIGIIIDNNINITNVYHINYKLKDYIYKLYTNGYTYIYVNKNDIKINDIRMSLHIPIIRYMCCDILKKYKYDENNKLQSKKILIGNISKINEEYISDNLRKIFTPLQENNKFIIDTYNSIHIIILDTNDTNNTNIKKLDVISTVLFIFEDILNIELLFNIIKKDKHYLSKVYLILEYMKDIYNYINEYKIDCFNFKLSKKYIELVILYFITIYRSIKVVNSKNDNIICSINNLVDFIDYSLFS
jgi:hypothetical protein